MNKKTIFEFVIALLLTVLVIFGSILLIIWLWNTLPRWLFWFLGALDGLLGAFILWIWVIR